MTCERVGGGEVEEMKEIQNGFLHERRFLLMFCSLVRWGRCRKCIFLPVSDSYDGKIATNGGFKVEKTRRGL